MRLRALKSRFQWWVCLFVRVFPKEKRYETYVDIHCPLWAREEEGNLVRRPEKSLGEDGYFKRKIPRRAEEFVSSKTWLRDNFFKAFSKPSKFRLHSDPFADPLE